MSITSPSVEERPDPNTARPSGKLSSREYILWHLVAIVSLAIPGRLPIVLSNDSYQYLSIADNLLTGNGMTTSIIHFDAQYSTGLMPAPQTTFGNGYSMVVAAFSRLGLERPTAGMLVSALCFVLTLTALLWAAPALGLGVWSTRAAALLLVSSAPLRVLAWSVASESLFMCLVTFAVAALAWSASSSREGTASKWMLVAFGLAGLSAWVRYAGYFVIAGMGLFALWHARRGPRLLQWATLGGLGISGTFAGALMLRNVRLVGNLRGGNEKVVHHSLGEMVRALAQSFGELVGGDQHLAKPGFLVFLLVVAALAFYGRHLSRTAMTMLLPAATVWVVYAALIFYAGLTTVISFGARMYSPLQPVAYLLVAGLGQAVFGAMDQATRRRAGLAVGIGLGVFALVQGFDSIHYSNPAPHTRLVERLLPIRDWLASHAAPDAVIAAPNQATAYELRHPGLSLVESEYSNQKWTAAHVEEVMAHYHANYLIVYPGLAVRDAVTQQESPFLGELCEGQAPEWLRAEVSTPGAILYRRE
jgi:hypothetical protein